MNPDHIAAVQRSMEHLPLENDVYSHILWNISYLSVSWFFLWTVTFALLGWLCPFVAKGLVAQFRKTNICTLSEALSAAALCVVFGLAWALFWDVQTSYLAHMHVDLSLMRWLEGGSFVFGLVGSIIGFSIVPWLRRGRPSAAVAA